MQAGNLFVAFALSCLAACVVIWPTQWISDDQYRRLRTLTVGLFVAQMLIDGPRVQLLPAYLVVVLFAVLLVTERFRSTGPSHVREAKESRAKKSARWGIVFICIVAVITSAILCLLYPINVGDEADEIGLPTATGT